MSEISPAVVARSVTVVSVIAAIAGIVALGLFFGLVGAVFAALLIIAVPFGVYYYNRWEHKQKSHVDLSALDSITFRHAMRCDIEKIFQLDKEFFDESEIIDVEIFCDWHEKNPEIFSCLVQDGEVIGYFSILPLHSEVLSRFIAGEISDKELTAADILTVKEAATQCPDLYFFSIVMARNHLRLIRSMFVEIARELHSYQSEKCLRRIYVTAATEAGRKIIKRFKFTLVQEAKFRTDGHDLFVKDVGKIEDLRDYMKAQLDR